MPRAPKKCLESGCRKPASKAGRCDTHYQPWAVTSPRNRTRPANAASLIRQARRRDRERCYLCSGPGRIVDHVVPVAEGGSWDLSNLACICDACHTIKSRKEAARGRARHP
ncbi:HNH endonuclease signature motif containing protein [Nonomuraea rosea]|uniref:HNH endonuclease signature motif containing protein n=1 Tax=Nonomuraea rosea TaxID=638574 RepID=A0ABP6VNN9_9ACTN